MLAHCGKTDSERYNHLMHLRKILISLSIITFLLVGATGVAYSGLMMSHDDTGVTGCPLMMGHDAAVCPMNPLAHINSWQSLFAAVPVQNAVTLLLLFLTSFFFLRFNQYLWLLFPSPQPVYISYDPEVATYDPLRRFIARGLMHPKIF